jgi:hypothetical protein
MRNMQIEKNMNPRPALPGRDEEYININGHLRVPVATSVAPAPERAGWEPFFVNINLADPVQKVVSYRRTV